MKSALVIIATVAWSMVVTLPAAGQTSPGGITGTIASPDGLRLPGATITVRDVAGRTVMVVSNAEGGYRLSSLRPGSYQVVVSMPGFEQVARDGVELSP